MRHSLNKLAAAILAAASTLFYACEKPVGEQPVRPDISVKSSTLPAGAGQMFVSVTASSDWNLSLDFGGDEEWASLNVSNGTGSKPNVILSYQQNSSEQERSLVIVLSASGSQPVMCTVEQSGTGRVPEPEPEPGHVDLTKVEWLEMPALDNPALGYYTHSFKMDPKDSKEYRNYSFGYSSPDGVALWVAYPLCKFYTNKAVNRTDAWALDPLLGGDSPAPFGGYAEELARGHQIPSADRLCCREANEQTFYGSNMTPQLNAHNEGIWSKLENSVRTWANTSDTTYVVTGCIVKGSVRVTTDSYGKLLTVPSAYFKAVLRYSKSSTIAQWAAAGFYLEHRDYGNVALSKEHSMSIDELEDITGMDFFVNLPARLGESKAADIEAQKPADSPIWW